MPLSKETKPSHRKCVCTHTHTMSSNNLVLYTSGGISSNPAAFILLIFLRTETSSSWVKGLSLISNCLLIIMVIGLCVTFGWFPSRFSKCCFLSFSLSGWFVVFNLALVVLFLLLTLFIDCQAILDCLSSTESLILSIWFCMYSVCSFRYMPVNWYCAFFLVLWHLCMLGSSYIICRQFSHLHVFF